MVAEKIKKLRDILHEVADFITSGLSLFSKIKGLFSDEEETDKEETVIEDVTED